MPDFSEKVEKPPIDVPLWGLQDKNLTYFQDSDFHDEISSEGVSKIAKLVGVSNANKEFMPRVSFMEIDGKKIPFVQFNLKDHVIATVEDLANVLETNEADAAVVRMLRNNGVIGFGTGIANVGCANTEDVMQLIKPSAIANDTKLSFFVPLPMYELQTAS